MPLLDFDPDAWLAQSASASAAKVAKVAKVERGEKNPALAGIAALAGAPLPAFVTAGLIELRMMPPPRVTRASVWPEVVTDAMRIANEGWAAEAISRGWEPLHLFGAEASPDPEAFIMSLAVWLRGRVVVHVAADHMRVIDPADPDTVWLFNRRERPGLVWLWEFGR